MPKGRQNMSGKELATLLKKRPHLVVTDLSKEKKKTNGKGPDPNATAWEVILHNNGRTSLSQSQEMNDTEKRFARELEEAKLDGKILEWHFEAMALKIGPKTWYFPDFVVIDSLHRTHVIEIKGFLRDDAAVKFKTAVGQYPKFFFHMMRRKNNSWREMYLTLREPVSLDSDGKRNKITRL